MTVVFYAEAWVHMLPRHYLDQLARGESIIVGNKVLAVCADCRCVVQLNKFLVGTMHHCHPRGGR